MKALIIDDEKHVRIAIEKLADWKSVGVTDVFTADNGKSGLEILRIEEPDFVFLDICMPIMNGLEFLECAKEEYPQSQFMIVSGYDDFHYAQSALRFGASDYLLKPIDAETLNKALLSASQKLLALRAEAEKNSAITDIILEGHDDDSDTLSPDRIAETIHNYIDTHYSENIKISMFSEKYFFSKEYISRNFKSKYGYGIYEYVLTVRMSVAAELLKDESIKIQEVGIRVGFADNNHFSKAFKNYYNVSPSEYRKDLTR